MAMDRQFRTAILTELEANGSRTLAKTLGRAWDRADSPAYRSVVSNELKILKVVYQVSPLSRLSTPQAKEEYRIVAEDLLNDALNDVPLNAFSSNESLETKLLKSLTARAKADTTSTAPRFSFDVSSGKLSIPLKLAFAGGEITAGPINIYKLAAATATAIACSEFGCIEKTARALFNEKDEQNSTKETPAQTVERLRRAALQDLSSDDPLRQFVDAALAETNRSK